MLCIDLAGLWQINACPLFFKHVLLETNLFNWEDLYDRLIAQLRANEPRKTLESVKKNLRRQGKLDD